MSIKQPETEKVFTASNILQRLAGLFRPLRPQSPRVIARTEAKQAAFERRVARRRAANKVARRSRRVNRLAAQR